MHAHFSEATFGSDSDKKIEYRALQKDHEYIEKYFPQNYLDSEIENDLKIIIIIIVTPHFPKPHRRKRCK